jgi:hypothetical protein
MARLSSTTLFNYTDDYGHLIDNLENGIHCGYHEERLPRDIRFRVAMTCFCDIPLGMIKNHFGWYGKYGIGINKAYAMKMGVVPVWYLSNKNQFLLQLKGRKASELSNNVKEAIKVSKIYYGTQMDVNGVEKKKKLYDEREWRYVPKNSDFQINNEIAARNPGDRFRFPLSLKHIEYIIVSSEEDLDNIVSDLERVTKKSSLNANLLISKILLADQIIRDF